MVSGLSANVSYLVFDGQQFDSIWTADLLAGGTGYTSAPTVAVSGCKIAPKVKAAVRNTRVESLALEDGFFSGSGCGPTVHCVMAGGGGRGATCSTPVNAAANPAAGTLVEVTGPHAHFENVTITRSASHGLHAGYGASALLCSHCQFLANQGDGALFQDVTDVALENLTSFENNRGWGVEFWHAAGSRFQSGDMGGNGLGGEHLCGIAQGYTSAGECGSAVADHPWVTNSHIIDGVQAGFNNGPDVRVDGWDPVHGAHVSMNNTVSHLKLIGSAFRSDNAYPAIQIIDSGDNLIIGNTAIDGASNRFSAGISITQTAPGRESSPDVVTGNSMQIQLAERAFVGVPNTVYAGNSPGVFPAAYTLLQTDAEGNSFYLGNKAGVPRIQRNGPGFAILNANDLPDLTVDDRGNAGVVNLTVSGQKAATGRRYACIDTAGKIVSSATPCSGT